jgi:hypothetical protein
MNDRSRVDFPAVLCYCFLFLIIIFSFVNFSYKFYPLLNADMAINILMTPCYHLPHDLYAWGQDRGGSLIPLLSHFLYTLVPLSPVSAVSVIHYMILIVGFFASATLFNSRITKILLAFIWFFPPWHFTDFVLFPFGTQFSIFMTGVWSLRKAEKEKNLIRQHLWVALTCLVMILGIWVSELGILMVLLLCCLVIFQRIRQKMRFTLKSNIYFLINIFVWVVVGVIFILYAKSKATRIDIYSDQPFNNFEEINGSVKIILRSLYDVFTFSSENFIESIYAGMLIIGIPIIKIITIFMNKGWFLRIDKKWFFFFILNGVLTFTVIILSHWAFLNGVGRRYFVLVYISFAIVILLMVETTEKRKSRIAQTILGVMILTGAISSVYKFYYPKLIPSRIKVLSELQSLGNIGIIAEYWNAYLSATPDPVHIKATPHDKDYVRNFGLAEEVFAQPRIYVIKDDWMDSFPDTIHQFGRTLAKKGDRFYMGQCWVNQYEISYPVQTFTFHDLKFQGRIVDDHLAKTGKAIMIGQEISYDKNRHFVFGPFRTLRPGAYIVRFYLKVKGNSSSSSVCELDISENFGKEVIASRRLTTLDFPQKDHYEEFDLGIDCPDQTRGVEFRIFYYGNTDLYFDHVNLLTIKTL